MDFNEIMALISGGAIYIAFASIVVVSYLLLALFNWSFVKPAKYIGVSLIIVGILLLIVRFGGVYALDLVGEDLLPIAVPDALVGVILKPLLIIGIAYIPVGALLIFADHLYYKKKNNKKQTKKHK